MKKLSFKDLNLKIVEKFKIFGPIALAVIIAGIIVLCAAGMNVGLDFAGGAKMSVAFGNISTSEKQAKVDKVTSIIKDEDFVWDNTVRWSESDEQGLVLEVGIQYVMNGKKINAKDTETQQKFSINLGTTESTEKDYEDTLMGKIQEACGLTKDDISCHIVSGSTSKITLQNALIALAVAVVVILIYIVIRFTLSSGIAAVIALCHDVLIMLACTIIFQVQVNVTFIAAVITIVGYSINATIVIFDRIRELRKKSSLLNASDAEVANKAICDTMGRSILTTITTLVTIVILAVVCEIANVSTMAEFALPIIFGLVGGFYSSVFLSSAIWVYLRKLWNFIKAKKAAKVANK